MKNQGIEKRNLSQDVVKYIKDKIFAGKLKSGDKLPETDISTKLGISRAPVREAMRELSMQGLVEYSPGKGNRMREMNMDEVIEMFEIRRTLENQIIEKILQFDMLSKKDYKQLQDIIDKMAKVDELEADTSSDTIFTFNELDFSFHKYLWTAAESPYRCHLLEGLLYQLLIINNTNLKTLGPFKEKVLEHQRILDGLMQKDLELTAREFKVHMDSYVTEIIKLLYRK